MTVMQICSATGCDVIGLQETRRAGQGSIAHDGYVIIWSGARAGTKDKRGVHGVGIAIKETMWESVGEEGRTVECISTRLMKAQDDGSRHQRSTKFSGARTPAGAGDSDSSVTSDSSDDESVSSEEDDDDDRNINDMDASSMSFRYGASGLRARSLGERKEATTKNSKAKGRLAKKRNDAGESSEGASSSSEEEGDDEAGRMSRKMADTYITESMSVTPASSVAVGSLMGRSLGQAMSSSFADDGLVWGTGAGGAAGTPDDAFFHENVSPCPSPPLAEAAISGRSRPLDIGVPSKRTLF
ncbi:unnamed protein product [Ectocarpus sp. CCAP 1310/34]|nr:unnamed protein product [Ectocarpus sp. CCAP 1310/34]